MDIELVKTAQATHDAIDKFIYDTWGVEDPHSWQVSVGFNAETRRLIAPSDPVGKVFYDALCTARNSLSAHCREAEDLLRKSAVAEAGITRDIISLTALRSEIEKRSKKVD